MQRARDMVVIGGGMAGVAAALAGAGRGARVTLVRRAPGATALCAGGWLGPLPAALAAHFESEHPWRAVDQLLPAPDGSLRRFPLAATAQAAVRFTSPTLVCGFAGLPGFHAAVLARLWSELAGFDARADALALARTPAAGWSPVSLAAEIERDPAELIDLLRSRVRGASARSVILPAVLGLTAGDALRSAISDALAVPVGEALGNAPSIPGWRLQHALERLLERANVPVLRGSVVTPNNDGRRLLSVRVRNGDTEQLLEADTFVLATGKFVGGGIVADGRLREPALDCPIWIEHAGETFELAEPLTLTNADRREDQPLLSAGVSVDAEGRAIDSNGDVVFDNVWTAGAVRLGHDAGTMGLGHAATEGWAAGERASS